MPGTKAVVKIDELGRAVIPVWLRRKYHLERGDEMQVKEISGGILLTPTKTRCCICGNTEYLQQVGQISVCYSCCEQLAEKIKCPR